MKAGLFPGQGISAREVLGALDPGDPLLGGAHEILGHDPRAEVARCAEEDDNELPTSLAQPALFGAGLAGWRRAQEEGKRFHYLAGHSLGEYTALVAAGAVPPEDALEGVKVRAEAMQDSSRTFPGGMAAVLKVDLPRAEEIAEQCGVYVANDNSPGQVVLSGPRDGLDRARGLVTQERGRWIDLKVSGAFHSPAMADDAEPLARVLDKAEIAEPAIPVISNVTARPHGGPDEIRARLVEQLTSRVRFRESLEWLWDQGVRDYEDLGPGNVAGGLARRTFRSLERKGDGGSG